MCVILNLLNNVVDLKMTISQGNWYIKIVKHRIRKKEENHLGVIKTND